MAWRLSISFTRLKKAPLACKEQVQEQLPRIARATAKALARQQPRSSECSERRRRREMSCHLPAAKHRQGERQALGLLARERRDAAPVQSRRLP